VAQRQNKKPGKIGRPRGPATPAAAAVARRNGRRNKAAQVPDAGAQPLDELDALRRMLARLDAATERLYTSRLGRRERDKEVRANARVMAALVPKARLRRAEATVRGELATIAKPLADPEMEPLPANEPHSDPEAED
jgi:hypothetical protein